MRHFELRGGADHPSCTLRSFRRAEHFFTLIGYDYMPKLTLTALLTGLQGSRLHGNRLFHLDAWSNCTNALLRWKFKELLARNNSMAVIFETQSARKTLSTVLAYTKSVCSRFRLLFKFQQIRSSRASLICYKIFASKTKRLICYWKALAYHWNVSHQKKLKLMEHGLFREIPWLSNDRKLSCS